MGKSFPELYARIPYNNETRRNIGFLHALAAGCNRLISIDDDNWPTDMDFIGGHSLTGETWNDQLVGDVSGFHNICEHLEFESTNRIYPRGFPFRLRGTHRNSSTRVMHSVKLKVAATAGLWLNDPDVDATTWLSGKITAKSSKLSHNIALEPQTWTPINTQNTSVARSAIPAFLCIPMGWPVPGGKIERYGDIWAGYFLQATLKDLPFVVAVGNPLVDHRRNPHDYLDDLRHEFWGMILTDWLVGILREDFKPEGNRYLPTVRSLWVIFFKRERAC